MGNQEKSAQMKDFEKDEQRLMLERFYDEQAPIVAERRIMFTAKDLLNWIVTAVEGGINYWCDGVNVESITEQEQVKFGLKYRNASNQFAYALLAGHTVTLYVYDDDNAIVSMDAIKKALTIIELERFCRLISGEYDAEDIDVLIQLAAFKTLVYG